MRTQFFCKEKLPIISLKKAMVTGEMLSMRLQHDRIVFVTGSPGGVNLSAPSVAVEEPGLEFFAFDASYVERLRSGDAYIEGHFVTYFS